MDVRGAFNGANLWGTLEALGGAVKGVCFYEKWGVDIPLEGSIDAKGRMVLSERGPSGPLSTITLKRVGERSWGGTWQKAGEASTGPAEIERIVRGAGEAVVVAKKRIHERTRELCCSPEAPETSPGVPGSAPCEVEAQVPFVLGLTDRAFQKSLNQELARMAKVSPEGRSLTVAYSIPMNERGFVSFAFEVNYLGGFVCGNTTSHLAGLTAAIDARVVARTAADYLDLKRAHAELRAIYQRGMKNCAAWSDPAEDPVAVLTADGILISYDNCANHVHADDWEKLPFRRVRSALRQSAFEAAWSVL
jgi:hypothetical protein